MAHDEKDKSTKMLGIESPPLTSFSSLAQAVSVHEEAPSLFLILDKWMDHLSPSLHWGVLFSDSAVSASVSGP